MVDIKKQNSNVKIEVFSPEVSGNISTGGDASAYYSSLAKSWANKIDTTVDGSEYSSKYYAMKAKEYSQTSVEASQSILNDSGFQILSEDLLGDNTIGICAQNISVIQGAESNAQLASAKANIATQQAEIATQQAEIAAQKVQEITSSLPDLADKSLSNITEAGKNVILNNSRGMSVGTIFAHTCSADFIPENSLPCNGEEYMGSQFTSLYTDWLVGGLLNTCTYEEYASDISIYGKCGKWALDTENGKFKTPYIPDGTHIQQAMTDDELGKSYNAGLPNITGTLGIYANSVPIGGAFYHGTTNNNSVGYSQTTHSDWAGQKFDASRSSSIYGNSDTIQTEAISLRYFVVVATGSIKQSEMDWSQWASNLLGKLNTDHSNDTKPYIDETYVNGTSGYIVYSNGLCEQWGRFSTGVTNIYFLKSYINTNYVVTYMQHGGASSIIGRVSLVNLYNDRFTVEGIDANMVPACWRSLGYIL